MRCTCTKQNETPIIQLVRSTKRKRSDPYLLQIRRISSSRSSFLISSRYWSPGLNRIDGCQFGDPSFPFNQKLLHFLNKTEAEGAQHNLRRQFIDRSSSHLIATCSWSSSGPNERKTALKLHMNRVSCNRSFPRIYYCAQIIPILRKPWARITISLFQLKRLVVVVLQVMIPGWIGAWSENMPKKCKLNAIFVWEAQNHDRSRCCWWWWGWVGVCLREDGDHWIANNNACRWGRIILEIIKFACLDRMNSISIEGSIVGWCGLRRRGRRRRSQKWSCRSSKRTRTIRAQNNHDDRDITINAYCYLISINSPLCLDNTSSPPLDRPFAYGQILAAINSGFSSGEWSHEIFLWSCSF